MASPRIKILHLRLRARELADWKKAARIADKTLSEWVRDACERLRDTVTAAATPLTLDAVKQRR